MPHTPLPDLAIVLYFLRQGLGISQALLGRLSGVSPNLINDYEKGRKTLHRGRLEYLISFMDLPPEEIDETLARLDATRAASRVAGEPGDPRRAAQRRVEAVAAQASRMAGDFTRGLLSLLTLEGEALWERQRAEALWVRLKRRTPEARIALVEDSRKFRGWALMERVAAASIEAAPSKPAQALELARLARRIAELSPGEETRRLRNRGYAEFHCANALRVTNDLPGSDESLAAAGRLWEEGAPGDPGLLSEVYPLWIEANIHREHGRFAKASKRIEEALDADRGELRGKLLLTKARIFEALGDTARSTAALEEAVPFFHDQRDLRTKLGALFQLAVNLSLEDRAAEAEPLLRPVRRLAERLGEELDLTRVVWVEGKVWAGLKRTTEAEAAFEQVCRDFLVRELDHDYALVSLDKALLLLEQGRAGEVCAMAEEMTRIFRRQRVAREALAALRIYWDAARREAATVELTRQVVRFLHRARHDPRLRFEAEDRTEGR